MPSQKAWSVEEFLSELASAAPTPGGGSAAALIGSTGAALLAMVCNVTLAKPGIQPHLAELTAARDESDLLRARLAALIHADIAAFNELMKSYRLPKQDELEQALRTDAIQLSLRTATVVPLECAQACAAVIGLSRPVASWGLSGIISDAGVAVLAAQSALRSAALNVQINAKLITDKTFAGHCLRSTQQLIDQGAAESEAVFAIVRGRL